MKRTKLQNGITLIALIITIIILLILAVVTIGSIKNSNIITYAQNASTTYNDEKSKEESAIAGYETLIESKLPGKDNTETITMSDAQLDNMLTKKVNSTTYDSYGNKIVVPAGFKILVDETTVYTADNIDVTKGIVIQDAEGNEFVWIPVGENIKNENGTAKIKLSRYTFYSPLEAETDVGEKVIDNSYQEVATSSYGNATAKNLSGFISSVNTNKGYFIGRYEAGVTGYDLSNITTENSDSETSWTGYIAAEGEQLKLVSKYGQQVWNYVTQNKASELCRNMYTENSNYTSDLINSYAWDTALVFIQTFGTETDANNYSRVNKSGSFTSTGVNGDKYRNIHDMSGNAYEWTTETSHYSNSNCINRGGYYDGAEIDRAGARANGYTYECDPCCSFRPILYL